MWPSPTKTYHNDTYAAIDPTLPALSSKGKNIVITGGGSGIGPAIARAFAKSGASSISLLGRTEKTLLETKTSLEKQYPDTKFLIQIADIVDQESLDACFSEIKSNVGTVDVLIANAGYLPTLTSIADAGIDEWYNAFEVNVKGNFNLVRAVLPVAAKNLAIIDITTGVSHLPFFKGFSGYGTSKVAAAKFFEYVHHEYPDFFVLNVHPGVIKTNMEVKTLAAGVVLPHDDIELPATFVVWAASPEARFLNGKLVWAHWDVDELKAMKKDIEGTEKFTLGLLGWP